MTFRPQVLAVLKALAIAVLFSYLFLFLFFHSYAWLSTHYRGVGDYRVLLKLFWSAIFVFAFDQNFTRIGLKLPRRETIAAGFLIPVMLLLITYQGIGYYVGWNATLLLHYACVGIGEELFLNGFLIARLRPLGVTGSATAACLIFASFHMPDLWKGILTFDDMGWALSLFSVGIFIVGIRYYTDSLLPGMVLHTLFDYIANFYASGHPLYGLVTHTVTPAEGIVWQWAVLVLFFLYGMALLIRVRKRTESL